MLVVLSGFGVTPAFAQSQPASTDTKEFNVRDLILGHVGDAYIWHITRIGQHDLYIPLPVIVKGSTGWHVFMSSKLVDGKKYEGFYISDTEDNSGKIVELDASGKEVRPWDISITRNVFTLFFSGIILIVLILYVAGSYKKNGFNVKNKLVCFMEMFIVMMNDDVIKPCVGKDYKKYAPYLLTLFFFILLNNLMGLIPIFPFGANLTGNIAFTFALSLITFIIVNVSGTKEYWKDIFWPDVPLPMKFPVPFFPVLELISVFTKPFALMIRLLANMVAEHSIILGLISIIFVTVSMGHAANASLSVVSVLLTVFIMFVELLVAFIQAYIFTLLSAVYIGLAKVEPHKK